MGEGFGDKVYEGFGPDNQPSKVKLVLEFMIYFVGLLGTVLALPQAYKIWFLGEIGGALIIPWVALASFTPFWILYGVMHKKRSLVMTYFVWFVVNILIIIGIMVRA